MTIIHVIIAYITNVDLQHIFGHPIYTGTIQYNCAIYMVKGAQQRWKMQTNEKNIHPDKSLV